MKYWLTTHWPNTRNLLPDAPKNGVYLPDKRENASDGMDVGDLVLFYESVSGRTILERHSDGSEKRLPCWTGRGGLVTLSHITSKPKDLGEKGREEYTDGTKIWWRFKAETALVNSSGFVPREQVCLVLGYAPTYNFRGFGTRHSGLKEITEEQFEQLRSMFVDTMLEGDEKLRDGSHVHGGGRGGGESPEHKALKEAIAKNPAYLLGVPGLRHWKTEHPFVTGDRVDVVLRDHNGRFVAVEVEVDCDQHEQAGPLQSMKYRALIAYHYDRQIDEVDTWLVARSIHPAVRSKCDRHAIRWKEVKLP